MGRGVVWCGNATSDQRFFNRLFLRPVLREVFDIYTSQVIEGGSINRCFQVDFSRKAGCGKLGRERRPISTARGNMFLRYPFSVPGIRDCNLLF
jgi:hypothetical protein